MQESAFETPERNNNPNGREKLASVLRQEDRVIREGQEAVHRNRFFETRRKEIHQKMMRL